MQQVPDQVQILHFAPAELTCRTARELRLAHSGSVQQVWTRACIHTFRKGRTMLWTLCVILLILWALGMATSYTAGGLIHILLVIAVIVVIFRLIQGRRLV
jgi:hypothetical protein